jgi:hypothetical protein
MDRARGCESEYFRFELYRNGNLHIVFKRADLVAKANKIVGDYYGSAQSDLFGGSPDNRGAEGRDQAAALRPSASVSP